MAGHARYTALLDANVLYPMVICDALMEVAATGIYAPKWSSQIDDEWVRNLARNKGLPEERFHLRREMMHEACPDWEVPERAWKSLQSGIELPDPGDRHVLAAALAGHADAIITQNLRHFPSHLLDPFGITALHPDEFLFQQLSLDPLAVLPAFKAMRGRLQNPRFTADACAGSLEKNGLAQTSAFLRQALQLI